MTSAWDPVSSLKSSLLERDEIKISAFSGCLTPFVALRAIDGEISDRGTSVHLTPDDAEQLAIHLINAARFARGSR